MKIISYNVNGIRAAMNKGLVEWVAQASPDVFCLQEIKALEEQVDRKAFVDIGYNYQYYHSAEKKGYSGVAILAKQEPLQVVVGTGIDYMDAEGRVLRIDYDGVSIISLYLPSGTNINRLEHKLKFMADFQAYVTELKQIKPNLVICGDYNICHEAIDIHDPVRNKNSSGFLPVEREWLSGFINSGFVDSFRHLNKDPHHYTWWSYRANARNNNKGWRIDYHMVSEPLRDQIKRAVILPEAKHSDHCPLLVELEV